MRALVTLLSLVFIFSTPSKAAQASCRGAAKGEAVSSQQFVLAEVRRLAEIPDALPGRIQAYLSQTLRVDPKFLQKLEQSLLSGKDEDGQPMSKEDIRTGLEVLEDQDVNAFARAVLARLEKTSSEDVAFRAELFKLSRTLPYEGGVSLELLSNWIELVRRNRDFLEQLSHDPRTLQQLERRLQRR